MVPPGKLEHTYMYMHAHDTVKMILLSYKKEDLHVYEEVSGAPHS